MSECSETFRPLPALPVSPGARPPVGSHEGWWCAELQQAIASLRQAPPTLSAAPPTVPAASAAPVPMEPAARVSAASPAAANSPKSVAAAAVVKRQRQRMHTLREIISCVCVGEEGKARASSFARRHAPPHSRRVCSSEAVYLLHLWRLDNLFARPLRGEAPRAGEVAVLPFASASEGRTSLWAA